MTCIMSDWPTSGRARFVQGARVTVSIEQAQASLTELIERTSRGEQVVITRDQAPVAELRAVAGAVASPRFASCKGALTVIAEDDEHLCDFAE